MEVIAVERLYNNPYRNRRDARQADRPQLNSGVSQAIQRHSPEHEWTSPD